MAGKTDKTKDYAQILKDIKGELTVIKGELAVLNEQNKVATYTNKITNKLLVGTSLLLVAFGVAELAAFGNNEVFAGNLSAFGLVFELLLIVGCGLMYGRDLRYYSTITDASL